MQFSKKEGVIKDGERLFYKALLKWQSLARKELLLEQEKIFSKE